MSDITQCPLCGCQLAGCTTSGACSSCPLNRGCPVTKCGNCGYGFPNPPAWVSMVQTWMNKGVGYVRQALVRV